MGSSPFARHYSGSRGFFPFLGLLRCFSSPAWLCPAYVFSWEYARITTRGFPHSEIPGSKVGQHLTGAYRSRPRPSSPPGAKASAVCPCSLDQKRTRVSSLWSFQGARGTAPDCRLASASRRTATACCVLVSQHSAVSQNSTVFSTTRSTFFQASRHSGRHPKVTSTVRQPPEYKSSGFPRKEVIQPQLPLRLPCYDFTPIIDPTFDGCLPCGLAHRLRVLPTFVV